MSPQTYQTGFSTTLALQFLPGDTDCTVANVPNVTAGRMKLQSGSVREWFSFNGIDGNTLKNCVRDLDLTAIPATSNSSGLSWIAGTPLKLVAMHDQLEDINEDTQLYNTKTFKRVIVQEEFTVPVYADDAARDAAITNPTNGMQIYNEYDDAFNKYQGGMWTIDNNGSPGPVRVILPNNTVTGARSEENISANDPVYSVVGRQQPIYNAAMNTNAWSTGSSGIVAPLPIKTGLAFTIRTGETGTISTVDSRCYIDESGGGTFGANNTVTMTGTFNIYAALGTPGSNGTPTGSALYTSTTASIVIAASSPGVMGTNRALSQAVFSGVTLAPGNYVMQFEGTTVGAGSNNGDSGLVGFAGTATGNMFQVNGVQSGTITSPLNIMYFRMNLPDSYVRRSDSVNIATSQFTGLATNTVVAGGNDLIYQNQGSKGQTGTKNTVYYLADGGGLATTPGTNEVMVTYTVDTDIHMIGVPFEKAITALTSGTIYYAGCNGIITGFSRVTGGSSATMRLEVYTGSLSTAVTTFTSGQGSGVGRVTGSEAITTPISKGQYFMLTSITTGSGSFTTGFKFIPNYV